jgi:pimeloyl-ACP methyl ester carboxylesterase
LRKNIVGPKKTQFFPFAEFGMRNAKTVAPTFRFLTWSHNHLKASTSWLAATCAQFNISGRVGCAQLCNYSAQYVEWGVGPPLVLVPGLAGGTGLLAPLARILSEHFRVIAFQLRGEDDCFALRRRFTLKDLASDLAEFLDWHQLERPIVMGVSFGATVALEFASRLPYRPGKLIIQGAGVRFERTLLQRVAGAVLSQYPLPADNPFVNQFFNLLFGARRAPDDLFRFVTKQCWQTDQSVMAYRFKLLESFNMEQRLRGMRVPTLLLAGSRDLLVSEQGLLGLRAALAQSQLVRLPECGHLAAVTHPRLVAGEVQKFCAGSVCQARSA